MKPIYSDDSWFGPFLEGDSDAYEYMFGMYYKEVFGFADSKLEQDPMAKDIVQEVFCKVYINPGRFYNIRHLENFLFLVTNNDCISYQRRIATYRKVLRQLPFFEDLDDADYEAQHLYEDLRKEMHLGITHLPEEKRKLLELLIAKKSRSEIAAELDIPFADVPVKKFRATQSLIRLLRIDRLLLPCCLFLLLPPVLKEMSSAAEICPDVKRIINEAIF